MLQLSRGIYPPLLAEGGLEVALRAVLGNSPVPVELTAASVGRYPPSLEAAAYFCCLEALQNAAKYSGASRIRVELQRCATGRSTFGVEDDGAGFDTTTIRPGSGLTNMRDRLDAVDGVLEMTSSPARGHPDRRPDPRGGGAEMGARTALDPGRASRLVFVVVDIAVTAAYSSLFSEEAVAVHGFPFTQLAVFGSAVMGAVILSRYERHAVGVLLSLIGVLSSFSLVTEAYHVWVIDEGGPGPANLAAVAGWVSGLTGGQLAFAELAVMFLLAPDGHFLSRRWRWAAGVIVVGAAHLQPGPAEPRTRRSSTCGTRTSAGCGPCLHPRASS